MSSSKQCWCWISTISMSVSRNVFWVLKTISLFSYREVDQDSDGCISFKEFECAMKHGQDEVSPLYFAWRMLSGEKTKWKLQISSYLKINETSFVSASILRTLTVSVALKNSLWSFTVDKLGVLIYMCMCA